jgi:phosphate-selective porin OprO/OprP
MFIRLLLLAAVAVGVAGRAAAAEPTRAELEERVRRLERIIEEKGLDQKGAVPEASADDPVLPRSEVDALVEDKLKKQKVLAGWQDGFFLQSPGGDFKMKLRGYLQVQSRNFPLHDSKTGNDTIFLRRARPIIEGSVYKYFDYRFMFDFGQGAANVQDAYMRVNYLPYAAPIIGKFKSPLSLERLQSGAELDFVERSLVNNLAPNREVAGALGGTFLGERVTYQLGIFDGAIDGRSIDGDVNSDKDFQGRLFVEPFKGTELKPLAGLGVGIAGTYGNARGENYNALNYRTAGGATFFRFPTSSTVSVTANGQRSRISPGAYYYWGPFGAMGEYIQNHTPLKRTQTQSSGPTLVSETDFDDAGWFLQASWVLTGEQATYKQVVPINAFDPRNGRWGAFELAGRVSQVHIDHDVFEDGFASQAGGSATKATAFTGGINWYLNRNFKIQLNWEHTEFGQKLPLNGMDRGSEDALLTQFQIAY